ncbi:MAG: hypothetical protein ACRDMX_10000 [Solirubrobacteraceae bacterium]
MTATHTKQNTNAYPDLEAAGERLRETNDRLTQAGRKLTGAYLDGFERYVHGLAQFERKLGEQSQLEPLAGVLHAHAKLAEDLTSAGVTAARELIAA